MVVRQAPEYGSPDDVPEFARKQHRLIEGAVWHVLMITAATFDDLSRQVPLDVLRQFTHLAWANIDKEDIAGFVDPLTPYRIDHCGNITVLGGAVAVQVAGVMEPVAKVDQVQVVDSVPQPTAEVRGEDTDEIVAILTQRIERLQAEKDALERKNVGLERTVAELEAEVARFKGLFGRRNDQFLTDSTVSRQRLF